MCGEFGEVTVIIGLVINFLAFVSPLLTLRDTSTYIFWPEYIYLLDGIYRYRIYRLKVPNMKDVDGQICHFCPYVLFIDECCCPLKKRNPLLQQIQ